MKSGEQKAKVARSLPEYNVGAMTTAAVFLLFTNWFPYYCLYMRIQTFNQYVDAYTTNRCLLPKLPRRMKSASSILPPAYHTTKNRVGEHVRVVLGVGRVRTAATTNSVQQSSSFGIKQVAGDRVLVIQTCPLRKAGCLRSSYVRIQSINNHRFACIHLSREFPLVESPHPPFLRCFAG